MGEAEVLRRISEKLYAGFYLYGAASYLVWLVVLSVFALLVMPFLERLPDAAAEALSIAYWLGIGLAAYWGVAKWFNMYLERLGASETRCSRIIAGWLLMPVLVALLGQLLEPRVEQAWPLALSLSLVYGSLVNAAAERCSGEKKPPSMVAALLLLAPGVPASVLLGWGGFMASLVLSYSTTALIYIVLALKRL